MIKEFIPYKIALALKELGFDEPCLAFFEINNTHQPQNLRYFLKTAVNREYIENTKILKYIYGENSLLAPLYQQVFRWFREKYGLHCVYNVGIPHDNITHSKKIQYFFNVVKCGKHHKGIFRSTFYTTYEEAELECLKKLTEIVKNK